MALPIRRVRLSVVVLGLGSILGAVPACSAQSGQRLPSPQGVASGPSRNLVYRPIFPGLAARPPRSFVPSGYAGATYPPLGAGPVLNPTGYRDWQAAAPRTWWWGR